MRVLGLETSCDETAVGLVERLPDGGGRILAHKIVSQLAEHRPYGGVVPEIAARAHLAHLQDLVRSALDEAALGWSDLDGIAATCGPGLIGGVMVGAMMGKALAAARKLPFCAVNHLEAHALTVRLVERVAFPYLLLLVSGGHCQLLLAEGVGRFRLLGATLDDAAGECFDKSAKLLGLGYPGGPAIERAAASGDPAAFALPRPLLGREDCAFSFSGLKTAVRERVETERARSPGALASGFVADMAASLQAAVAGLLEDRSARAFDLLEKEGQTVGAFVAAGGVAANKAIRARLAALAESRGVAFHAPPPALCTDNGVMVAWAGAERLAQGRSDGLDCAARPRWPLGA